MSTQPAGKRVRRALWISPVVLSMGGLIAWLHWSKPHSAALVTGVSTAVSLFVMGYSSFVAGRMRRHLDEVQLAHQQFAHSRGWGWGLAASILLLMLTPASNWLIDLANVLTTGSAATSNRTSVRVALFFGFTLVALMQAISVVVAAVIWERRMGLREKA